jgi:hypothetical protein
LSTEIGCTLRWYEPHISAGTVCPMPDHKDTNPSFRIKFIEEDSLWIFHCLGCNSKGTIIDFCREYYNLNSSAEAVMFICDKFGFKKTDIVVTDGLKDVKKKINIQKKIACSHIVAARQCFSLLKRDYNQHNIWVKEAYKTMNKALDSDDIETIESIGFEASKKLQEK